MQEWIRKLSDFFFITGSMCTGVGVLAMISAAGGFDGIAYIFYSLRVRMSGSETKWRSRKTFFEYRLERQKKARSPKWLVTIGLIALALSLVFALCYQGT